jgi:hypothetical protein
MASYAMLRRVPLVTIDVSEKYIESIIRVKRIGSSETLILARQTWRHIPEDSFPYSHCIKNLKSYIVLTG